jgi:hypothetical protein
MPRPDLRPPPAWDAPLVRPGCRLVAAWCALVGLVRPGWVEPRPPLVGPPLTRGNALIAP